MKSQRIAKAAICLAAIQGLITGLIAPAFSAQSATTTTVAPGGRPAGAASVAVSPPTADLTVTPGNATIQKISVINGTDSARTFTASSQNAISKGEEGQADLTPDEGKYSLQAWMKITPERATIPPNGTADFQVAINVPTNAGPGGHFGGVVFTPTVETNGEGTQVSVVAQVSALILVNVPGTISEKASLDKFYVTNKACSSTDSKCKTDKKLFSKGPLNFSTLIKNDSNIVQRPYGTVTVKNIFGKKVYEKAFEPQRVLPESSRRFDVPWDHKILFGRYTAEVKWTYGQTPQTATTTLSFWGLPTKLVVLVLGVVLALFFFGWLPRKRIKKAMRAFADAGDDDKPAGSKSSPETTSSDTASSD